MRAAPWILATGLLLPLASALASEPGPDSPNVASARHEPVQPVRGHGVELHLLVRDATGISRVAAVYCRVQLYACAPSLAMDRSGNASASGTEFVATIPWEPQFFRGVTDVGYNFDLQYENGTREASPVRNSPTAPAGLPADAGTYYFYSLPPAAESPAPGAVALVVGFAIVAAALGRARTQ